MHQVVAYTDSPLGPLRLVADEAGLREVAFTGDASSSDAGEVDGRGPQPRGASGGEHANPVLERAKAELAEYFAGSRTRFDVPIAPEGTPFQREVWTALREIPFGETRSYGAIAKRIHRPSASRAVGAANGRNPLAIVVPCHRVIGSGGELVGYASGTERKAWL